MLEDGTFEKIAEDWELSDSVCLSADDKVLDKGEEKTESFSSKLGSPYVTVTLGGQTYEGLFIKQHKETAASAAANAWTSTAAGNEAMCFTLMGRSTERAVWGYMT